MAGLALAVPAAPAGPAAAVTGWALAPVADPVVDSISADVAPHVSVGGAPVVLSGTVTGRNLPAAGLTVVVRRGSTTLPDRAAVAAWADGTEAGAGGVLASGRATRTPAGATFRFSLSMTAFGGERPYGVVPISIEAGGRTIHSFVPFHERKEYEPLRLAFAVPVVGAPDPRKYGSVEERLAAWTAEADPGGRLPRLLDAVRGAGATLLLDPALLDAGVVAEPPEPTATATATPTPTEAREDASYAASAEEVTVRTALADAVRAGVTAGGSVLRLPASDPDIAAATAGDGPQVLVAERVRHEPAERTVLWPADGGWTTPVEQAVDALDPGRTGIAIADSAWLRQAPGQTTEAVHRTRGGTTLLVSDHALSTRLGGASDGRDVQAFLADTVALLAERPGTTRSYLVTLPRDVSAGPAWVSAMTTALASPWVEGLDVPALAAAKASATVTPSATHPGVAPSPLARFGAGLDRDARDLAAAATVRADAVTYLARWAETARALTSTGWRRDPGAWRTLAETVRAESREVAAELTVPPREINFLADSGRIRIVVANGLPVPVRGLRLRLVPESPRLRIDSAPIELAIGAESRTTVTVAATALAAGEVPVRAVLLTPSGEELSSSTNIRITVTPTGAGVYWVIGGVAVLVLLLGVLRSRRRRRAGTTAAGTLPA